MIHELIDEQVPVDQLGVLIASFADSSQQGLTPEQRLEAARQAVAPGLRPRFERTPLPVPEDLERDIMQNVRTLGRERVLTLPDSIANSFLDRLDAVIGPAAPSEIVLRVADARARPFVQHLIHRRRVGVPVVSTEELKLLRREGAPTKTGALV
jgi:flagellar biosynthesis component FlhA